MARPPKKDPYLKPNDDNLPEVGTYYISGPEIIGKIAADKEGKKRVQRCVSIAYAPVEMIVPHGSSSYVYFDQEKTRFAEALFDGDFTMTAPAAVKELRRVASEIERLIKG